MDTGAALPLSFTIAIGLECNGQLMEGISSLYTISKKRHKHYFGLCW